jgi:hypothetical protein
MLKETDTKTPTLRNKEAFPNIITTMQTTPKDTQNAGQYRNMKITAASKNRTERHHMCS